MLGIKRSKRRASFGLAAQLIYPSLRISMGWEAGGSGLRREFDHITRARA
jgi:hypothetical protein